jgi:transcriptional regulator with XRE-family HTH domain
MELGTRIEQLRIRRGMSQYALAKSANVSTTYIQKLERGAIGNPSLNEFLRVAEALRVSVLDLLSDDTNDEQGDSPESAVATDHRLATLVRSFDIEDPEGLVEEMASLSAIQLRGIRGVVESYKRADEARQAARRGRKRDRNLTNGPTSGDKELAL